MSDSFGALRPRDDRRTACTGRRCALHHPLDVIDADYWRRLEPGSREPVTIVRD